jgi:ribosome-binding factor A
MSRRRRVKLELTDLAADFGPEDGSDPKEFHSQPWAGEKRAGRKTMQLCGQVKDALHQVFAACGDDVLQALTVVAVEPAPHSGRLLVVVTPDDGICRAVAERHLSRAAGMLRAEVAAAINRRYAPELVFEVIR